MVGHENDMEPGTHAKIRERGCYIRYHHSNRESVLGLYGCIWSSLGLCGLCTSEQVFRWGGMLRNSETKVVHRPMVRLLFENAYFI
jgi:hypothetical protein